MCVRAHARGAQSMTMSSVLPPAAGSTVSSSALSVQLRGQARAQRHTPVSRRRCIHAPRLYARETAPARPRARAHAHEPAGVAEDARLHALARHASRGVRLEPSEQAPLHPAQALVPLLRQQRRRLRRALAVAADEQRAHRLGVRRAAALQLPAQGALKLRVERRRLALLRAAADRPVDGAQRHGGGDQQQRHVGGARHRLGAELAHAAHVDERHARLPRGETVRQRHAARVRRGAGAGRGRARAAQRWAAVAPRVQRRAAPRGRARALHGGGGVRARRSRWRGAAREAAPARAAVRVANGTLGHAGADVVCVPHCRYPRTPARDARGSAAQQHAPPNTRARAAAARAAHPSSPHKRTQRPRPPGTGSRPLPLPPPSPRSGLVEAVVVHLRKEGEPQHRAAGRGAARLFSWVHFNHKRILV
jgi:hypothetical protein